MLSRRAFLNSSAAAVACAGLPMAAKAKTAADPFMKLDATAQAALVATKQATSLELVNAAITRIEKLNPAINAVVTPSFEQARGIAQNGAPSGPFQGVPYLIKDLADQKGVRTTYGSKLFAENIAREHSVSTEAQLSMGLVSLGKSNTPEFGFLPTTESLLLGPSRTPWNTEHSSGGSSGGAAAAVAAGMVPVASASDGGGSIRIPASCCGVFGLKTSRGRTISQSPPGFELIAVRNVVSRSIRDSATVLHGIQATNDLPTVPLLKGPSGKKLRVALNTTDLRGAQPHPDVKAAIEATAKLCEDLGHDVEEARVEIDGDAFADAFLTVWANGAKGVAETAKQLLGGKDPRTLGVLEPFTLGLVDWFESRPADQLEKALAVFDDVTRVFAAHHQKYDVSLTPVLNAPPPKIGYLAPDLPYDTVLERMLSYVGYTPIANATGEPAMSVPLGWSSEGLPIGSQFQAGLGQEALLLDLAFQLEEAAPWAEKWPTMSREI